MLVPATSEIRPAAQSSEESHPGSFLFSVWNFFFVHSHSYNVIALSTPPTHPRVVKLNGWLLPNALVKIVWDLTRYCSLGSGIHQFSQIASGRTFLMSSQWSVAPCSWYFSTSLMQPRVRILVPRSLGLPPKRATLISCRGHKLFLRAWVPRKSASTGFLNVKLSRDFRQKMTMLVKSMAGFSPASEAESMGSGPSR